MAVRLLTRYVVAELVKVFLLVLAVMTPLITIALVMQQAVVMGFGVPQVLPLLPYVFPVALRFAVPGTILFAVCSVFGRLSASNELIALKSLGISPLVVLWPCYVLGFLLSLGSVWLNDVAVSWGETRMREVVIASLEDIAYSVLKSQGTYRTPRFSVVVKGLNGRELIQPRFKYDPGGGELPVNISADRAILQGDPDSNTMNLVLYNSELRTGDGLIVAKRPDKSTYPIPLPDLSRKERAERRVSNLALREIPRDIRKIKEEIRTQRMQLAARASFQLLTGEIDSLASGAWRHENSVLESYQHRLARLHTEPHRRWANGFSCLAFVFVGAPVAIWLRNADFLTSFFACFLPILVLYYPLLAYGVDQAKGGDFPAFAVWMGNVLLVLAGLWFLRRVMRY